VNIRSETDAQEKMLKLVESKRAELEIVSLLILEAHISQDGDILRSFG
jgi:hypothetical protein